ncbi:MAG: hypothetical protein RIR26_221 [Pseudomonadota bacterium]|jgi:exodeoxyribonuclease VII small subunit
MTLSKTASYKELQAELQRIMGSLEQESTSLDDLGALLKSGFETVDALRMRLTESEAQIENIISLRHNSGQTARLEIGEGDSQE